MRYQVLRTTFFLGQLLEFVVDEKPCFEIPLSNVSNCTAGKSEAIVEFHQNEDCAVSLMEMRFHIPTDPDGEEDVDPVEVCISVRHERFPVSSFSILAFF